MIKLFTIGFTKKDAKTFFDLLNNNGVTLIVDVRLNNTSQLAGFSKYPDIEYFLKKCANCIYISDKKFSPEETTLNDYKKKKISWDEYVLQFNATMKKRNIIEYIKNNYLDIVNHQNICFLCSEETPEHCHRRLIAEIFVQVFDAKIFHLK